MHTYAAHDISFGRGINKHKRQVKFHRIQSLNRSSYARSTYPKKQWYMYYSMYFLPAKYFNGRCGTWLRFYY